MFDLYDVFALFFGGGLFGYFVGSYVQDRVCHRSLIRLLQNGEGER